VFVITALLLPLSAIEIAVPEESPELVFAQANDPPDVPAERT
jgi:hypothetical protein